MMGARVSGDKMKKFLFNCTSYFFCHAVVDSKYNMEIFMYFDNVKVQIDFDVA